MGEIFALKQQNVSENETKSGEFYIKSICTYVTKKLYIVRECK